MGWEILSLLKEEVLVVEEKRVEILNLFVEIKLFISI